MKILYNTSEYVEREDLIKEYIIENELVECEEDITEDMLYSAHYNLEEWDYEDFKSILKDIDIELNGDYLVIASLGLWNGRVQGYREASSLLDAVFSGDCDNYKVGIDGYNLVVTASHHDGTNYYTIKEWKDDITYEQKENLLDKIYSNTASKKDIARYTNSIRKTVANYYGW